MTKVVWSIVIVLMMATSSLAQKPQGAYDAKCEGPFQYSTVADFDYQGLLDAVACSRQTGRVWILLAGFGDPIGSEVDAQGLKNRMDQIGLTPYITALIYREEWYGMLKRGEIPLPQSFESIELIKTFGSRQQCRLREVFMRPIIYVDQFVNEHTQWGYSYYQPLPSCTDAFGFEAYVPSGGSWESNILPWFNHHRSTYPTLPLVIVGQGFKPIDGE